MTFEEFMYSPAGCAAIQRDGMKAVWDAAQAESRSYAELLTGLLRDILAKGPVEKRKKGGEPNRTFVVNLSAEWFDRAEAALAERGGEPLEICNRKDGAQ